MLIHVPQIPADHTGPVPQWNNEIRGISVYHRLYHLVLIKPLYQSSQEIQADLRSYQPTPRAALPLPLSFARYGQNQVLMENHFLTLLSSMTLLSQHAAPFSIVQRNPTLAFHLPLFPLTFPPCFCATFLEIKSLWLVLTALSSHHLVFADTLSQLHFCKDTEFNF